MRGRGDVGVSVASTRRHAMLHVRQAVNGVSTSPVRLLSLSFRLGRTPGIGRYGSTVLNRVAVTLEKA